MALFGNAFPSLIIPKAVIISDRHKGLLAAIRQLYPACSAARCCQHIADNIAIRYGKACRKLFWTCAYAKTRQSLTEAIEMLRQHNAPAAAYLKDIDAVTWATAVFPAPRYGHLTSKLVESVNGHWLEAIDQPALGLLSTIWQIMAQKILERSQQVINEVLCARPQKHFAGLLAKSGRYNAALYDIGIGIVTKGAGSYSVDLTQYKCSCGEFTEYQSLCVHALALCTRQRLDPYHYVSNIYRTETHRQQYSKRLMPINIAALLDSDVCNPPIYQQVAGRPAKARKRAGQRANTATRYHCSRCGAEGHTRRSQQCRGDRRGFAGLGMPAENMLV